MEPNITLLLLISKPAPQNLNPKEKEIIKYPPAARAVNSPKRTTNTTNDRRETKNHKTQKDQSRDNQKPTPFTTHDQTHFPPPLTV